MTPNHLRVGPPSNCLRSRKNVDGRFRVRVKALRAASVGWNFVTAPLVGAALGYGIDTLAGVYPWTMVVGIILGFVSAFIEVMRLSR